MKNNRFDVVIIGGSYAGLSAAMALGRSLRNILVIDSGNPCNKQTPHSHNFLTNDGSRPRVLHDKAKAQVLCYPGVEFIEDKVIDVTPLKDVFEVITESGGTYETRKVLFATGLKDTIPNIPGFADCWGVSILHCPYCHGYEVKGLTTGILGNGDMAYELARLISHWSKDLTIYTNGTSTLNPDQVHALNRHGITVIENAIEAVEHEDGYIKRLYFEDTEPVELKAMFTKLPFVQHCDIPEKLGCKFLNDCFIEVDKTMQTSVPGIYAAGDCLTLFRSVANAVAAGNKAGAMINKVLIDEQFDSANQ